MPTVAQLLKEKGHAVWSIAPEAMVYDALSLMAEKNVGALVVVENTRVIGILSERDYARKVILKGRVSKETRVREIMSDKVYFVRPAQTIEECMTLMTAEHVRHLPVLEDGQLVGIISIGDVVKVTISEKEFLIAQLQNYITGSGGAKR
jgi:CBS domain-containing protein